PLCPYTTLFRSRQALMLGGHAGNVASPAHGHGNLKDSGGNIVCPLHRWTYNNRGELLGAPQFDSTPCMNLQRFRLRDCHGLLFEGPRDPAADLAPLFARPEFDFGDYVLDHVEVHHCNYNCTTFIEGIVPFRRDFVQAQRAAYMETAVEDDEIAERMDAGRKALMARGVNQTGPYQSPMEDGMQHFHEWYRRIMQEPAAPPDQAVG